MQLVVIISFFLILLLRCLTLIPLQCAAPLAWHELRCVGFSVVLKDRAVIVFGLELPAVPSLCSLSRKRRGATSALSGSERIDALRYQRIKKAKKMTMNNNNSKMRKKAGLPFCLYLYINCKHTVLQDV